jgi:hypothetical protein
MSNVTVGREKSDRNEINDNKRMNEGRVKKE